MSQKEQPTWFKDLEDFAHEGGHASTAACYESDAQDVRDPDNCERCYLEQILYDAKEWLASHAPSDKNAEGLIWAVERWNLEVRNRPIRNVHYRTLDETWRQVMRHFGGDPDELVGPPPQYSAPSEAAAQPTLEMPMNRKCNKCGWVHATGGLCPLPDAVFRAEIEHNDH